MSAVEEFRPTMNTVVVSKEELLKKLEANRKTHRKTFEKALQGWKETVVETLEKALKDARADKRYEVHINLMRPVDQTREYDRAIEKMKMSQHDQVYLTDQEFAQYVMDDWAWKQQFTASTSAYLETYNKNH